MGWRAIEERGCNRKEKTEYQKSQWKWRKGSWLFSPLATPEMLTLICVRRGFPSSPAAHGANVVMVRKPTVKMAPSHSAEWLSADLQVRAAQLTDKNKLLLLLAPRSQCGQEKHREILPGHAHRQHNCQGNLPSRILQVPMM